MARPPKFAQKLLYNFLREDLAEEVSGDLEERFRLALKKRSLWMAKANYWYEVLNYLRPFAFKRSRSVNPNNFDMFRNYLKISTRTLLRQKLYSTINIGGLALGLTCFTTILLYVQHEFSYNKHYPEADRIYRVYQRQAGNDFGGTDYFSETPAPLARVLVEEVSEVKYATSIQNTSPALITVGDQYFYEKGLAADAQFFQVLPMTFVEGNPNEALKDPMSIVLTKSLARTMFGEANPVGQTVRYLDQDGYHVTAIIEDAPRTSSLQYSYIVNINYNFQYRENVKQIGWNNNAYHTFFKLAPGADAASFDTKFAALLKKYQLPEDYQNYPFKDTYYAEPLTDIYFHSDINFDIGLKGNRNAVYLYALIALIVLALACVNYMNLAVARSIKRAREVGLRKVAGAVRSQLLGQFLGESILISFISLILALVLTYLLVPYFGILGERPVEIDLISNPWLIPGLAVVVLLVGIISGSYPALVMSKLKPIDVLKAKTDVRVSGFSLQKILIVVQFAASSVLIISSLIIYQQLNFMQNKDLGYNKEDIVAVRIRDFALREKFDLVSNEVKRNSAVINTALSSSLPTNVTSSNMMYTKLGLDKPDLAIYTLVANYDYLDLFGIELVAGRYFDRKYTEVDGNSIVINETAAKALGYSPAEAIDKPIYQGSGRMINIIGVVKDFHIASMHLPVHPLMIQFSEKRGAYFSFKIKPENKQETLVFLEQTIKKFSPYPFEYEFLDDNYNNLYSSEAKLGEIFGTFTAISIIIASLGLFGLAAFMAGQRTKEIGIRKVLGASGRSIVILVSRDFMVMVVAAFVLAAPIGWYVMNEWLEEFAYRIDIQWWTFALAGLLAFLIANVSIGYQSVKAAAIDPVDSLRGE